MKTKRFCFYNNKPDTQPQIIEVCQTKILQKKINKYYNLNNLYGNYKKISQLKKKVNTKSIRHV